MKLRVNIERGDGFMNVLEFAINMELDGEKYYNEQAKINKDNSLHNVFVLLAKEEGEHAQILKNKSNGLPYKLEYDDALSKVKNIFKDNEDFKSEISKLPSQLDLYNLALEKEKQSIELYEKFLSEASDDSEKEMFQFLTSQEKNHYAMVEVLISLLMNANEWVESPEFGIRKDY